MRVGKLSRCGSGVRCTLAVAVAVSLFACLGGSHVLPSSNSYANGTLSPEPDGVHVASSAGRLVAAAEKLPKHVIVIVMENRTVDNLFQKFPGAQTRSWGINHLGRRVDLVEDPLITKWDLGHGHSSFVTDAAYPSAAEPPALNGFDQESVSCPEKTCPGATPYSYVNPNDVAPYYQIAQQYAFADETFQANKGPSFPAHQYLIAGQSGGVNDDSGSSSFAISENPKGLDDFTATGGCNAPYDLLVLQIDMNAAYPGAEGNPAYPCENYKREYPDCA